MTVPLERVVGLFAAQVWLTSSTQDFKALMYIDTGAYRTIIKREVAEALDVAIEEDLMQLTGISGPARGGRCHLRRMMLDARVVEDVDLAVADLPYGFLADGLLGLDFLGRGRADFDFDAGSLSLHD